MPPPSSWSRFIAWIDRDIPFFLSSQPVLAGPPLLAMLLVGPETTIGALALCVAGLVQCLLIWRLILAARRRWHIDRQIRRGMMRCFRNGKRLPRIKKKGADVDPAPAPSPATAPQREG